MTGLARRHAAVALALYVLLTGVQGRLVLQHGSDHIASDAGDPVLNLAILRWTTSHIPLSQSWWDFPGFFPLSASLTFSEHLTGLLPIAGPLAVLDRPVLTYNILFLLSFVASAMGAYALAYALTQRADAAFLAGLVFGFAPYRVAHLAQLQMLSVVWMPLSLLALHRYVATQRIVWAITAAGAWLLQGLTSSYALVHLSLLTGLWACWFVVWPRRWKALAVIAGAYGLAGLVFVPFIRQYVAVHAALGLRRDLLEISGFGADVLALVDATSRLSIWGWVQYFDRPEGELFPGVALSILLLGCVLVWWRTQHSELPPQPPSRLRRFLMAGSAIAGVAAGSVWLIGPWALALGPIRLSSSGVQKPMTLALIFIVAAVASSALWRSALRASSALAFYAAAAVITWLLALGPAPMLGGSPILHENPYSVLMSFPGVDRLRVPARFWMMTILCLAPVTAILFARVTNRLGSRFRWVVTAVAAAGLAADGWTTVPVVPAPTAIEALTRFGAGSNVLEIPLGDLVADAAAQYRAVEGGWHSFNGYSGYSPPHYRALQYAVETSPGETFDLLRRYGPLTVSVDTARDRDDRWLNLVQNQPLARRVASGAGVVVFRFSSDTPSPAAPTLGAGVTLESIISPCDSEDVPLLTDGDVATAWECLQSEGTPELLLEIPQGTVVASITEWFGERPGNPSARLEIDTSLDGATWEPAWEGPVAPAALRGSLTEPTRNPVQIHFAARSARYLRLRQRAEDPAYSWWVAELRVNAP